MYYINANMYIVHMAKYITIFLTRSFWGKNWMHTTYSSYFFWFDFKRISGKLKFVSWFSCLKRLFTYIHSGNNIYIALVNVWGKRFKLPQLTHKSFLTIDHSCKISFWYLPNWTFTNLWYVQGVSYWNVLFELALRGRRTNNVVELLCLVASGGVDIWVSYTSL